MKIVLDADATPVLKEVVAVASLFKTPLLIISDYNHHLESVYGDVIMVDQAQDSADHAIISQTVSGDLVITQDYGLAALILSKNAYAMHHDGWFYKTSNIDQLLMRRHLQQKERKFSKRYTKIPKRKTVQNSIFKEKLTQFLIEKGVTPK